MKRRTWTDGALIKAVKESVTVAQVLRALNLVPAGGNYHSLKLHIERLGLETNHFLGQGHNKGKTLPSPPGTIPLSKILVEHSTYTSNDRLKIRLVREGLLEYRCSEQGCEISEWKGAPLSLHLDHKNGNRRDNRLDNLRFLCPNCHSQTPTYCGKNIS
jgi:hypothetical protein